MISKSKIKIIKHLILKLQNALFSLTKFILKIKMNFSNYISLQL